MDSWTDQRSSGAIIWSIAVPYSQAYIPGKENQANNKYHNTGFHAGAMRTTELMDGTQRGNYAPKTVSKS